MDPTATTDGQTHGHASGLAASWKRYPDRSESVTRIPFAQARQFFAVDASGSTAGGIIRSEQAFVEHLHNKDRSDSVVTWGHACGHLVHDPSEVRWEPYMGGTAPSVILADSEACGAIVDSEVWYLLTDGEISTSDVQSLASLATANAILNVPVIFLITGHERSTPDQIDVSVGITFFANAQDVLCLFRDVRSGLIYVIAGKGCFMALASEIGQAAPDLSSWEKLRCFANEEDFLVQCRTMGIEVPTAATRPKPSAGIRLGEEWETANGTNVVVDVDALLVAGMLENEDLEQLLTEEAFNNLAVAFKTRGRIADLRSFIAQQKVEQMNVKLEDVSGASAIIARLGEPDVDPETRETLRTQLREAHANNRQNYQHALKEALESPAAQAARARNRSVDRALQQLAEIESTGYTADILSRRSNRARRAATVAPTESGVAMTRLDLEAPNAFRGECSVCCGDDEVMSIALKTGADGAANTDNFALDFPLAAGRFKSNQNLISSQCICFQCALLGRPDKSIFGEAIVTVLPTLDYTGTNKKYIQEQLYLALTGGLRTGASGASQLFMTILDGVLKEKEWAGAGSESPQDAEVIQRRAMLQWVLANMLENTGCRETFNEQGPWTTYKKALAWAAKDFRTEGLGSWAVQYPVAGFMQLMAFGKLAGAFDDETIRDLRAAKVLHSVTSAFLALLFKNSAEPDSAWKQPLLAMIYGDFNAELVPKDMRDSRSLITSAADFWSHLSAFLTADRLLLEDWETADKERVMRRVQLLVFWLVYFQKGHTSAKSFFKKLREDQSLAPSVVDVRLDLPPAVVEPVLLSIFREHDNTATDVRRAHTGDVQNPPFATPFGPSVLRCTFAECGAPFIDPVSADDEWTPQRLNQLRLGRAKHLIEVFGVDGAAGRFSKSQNGMPEHGAHVARLTVAERRAVLAGGEALDAFVGNVRVEICAGRRGDVFQDGLDEYVRELMPSFWEALRTALKVKGTEVDDVAVYEHDWTENKLESKVRYELTMMNGVGGDVSS